MRRLFRVEGGTARQGMRQLCFRQSARGGAAISRKKSTRMKPTLGSLVSKSAPFMISSRVRAQSSLLTALISSLSSCLCETCTAMIYGFDSSRYACAHLWAPPDGLRRSRLASKNV